MVYTHLKNRTVIRVAGGDALDFLQGLITNDIRKTDGENMIYACFLTPQGKFLFDLFIIATDDGYLLDVEATRHQEFLMRLTMYKLRADVTLTDETQNYGVYAVWGEGMSTDIGFTDPRFALLGRRLICDKNSQLPFSTPIQAVEFEVYDQHRLKIGVPDGARDMISERSAMLECNMDHLNALDWDKGCYMGQELTARTHYRGLVKRRLMPFTYQIDAPDFGTVIRYGDEKIGEVRSTNAGYGLALVKCQEAEDIIAKKQEVTAGESHLMLHHPAYASSSSSA